MAPQAQQGIALKIVDGIAAPTAVLVYFSEKLPQEPSKEQFVLHVAGESELLRIPVRDLKVDNMHKTVTLELGERLKSGQRISVLFKLDDGNVTLPVTLHVNGESKPPGNIPADTRAATKAAEDAVAYPLMTEQVGLPPNSSFGAGGGGTGGGQLQIGKTATQAISDVLGWKINDNDAKGFVGALTQSFSLKDVEGHVEATWTPRTYAVQTDLAGGITGAQASIYLRAQEALKQALPLLEGLYALNPDSDDEMVTALKDVVKSQFSELVNELALPGGPRISRINQYFELLLGGGPFPVSGSGGFVVITDPDKVGGNLGRLRDELQLQSFSHYINTVEDEKDITNYRILADYFTSLAQSWVNNVQFFGLDTKKAFLGSQLVLISRQLSTVGEAVGEVRFTMDSVFIGPSERQTTQLEFASGDPAMFIEDLLNWVEAFAKDEGPDLIKGAGKLGVGDGFVPVVKKLVRFVHEAKNPTNKVPDGYRTKRVQNSLDDLEAQLRDLQKLAEDVQRRKPPTPFDEQRIMDKIDGKIDALKSDLGDFMVQLEAKLKAKGVL